jgi:hypothetical protein
VPWNTPVRDDNAPPQSLFAAMTAVEMAEASDTHDDRVELFAALAGAET